MRGQHWLTSDSGTVSDMDEDKDYTNQCTTVQKESCLSDQSYDKTGFLAF